MDTRDEALGALHTLDPGGMTREQWVRVAFAAKDAGVSEDEWMEWCARGANFNHADALATWRHAQQRPGGVTAATLYMMARDAGWRPPEERRAAHGGNGAAQPAPPARPAPPAPPAPPARAAPAAAEPPPTDPEPIWQACRAVEIHPYLSRKGIKAHGTRVNSGGALAVPYYNRERRLQTLQTIQPDGTKRFLAGARAKGACAILGEPAGAPVVVVCEGFATAAALEESTGYPTLAAGSRVSLPEGAKIARHFTPHGRVIIAADRGDLSTPLAAARAVAGFLAVPGPENAADGYDFADWRGEGATEAEIRACVDRARPVESEAKPAALPPASSIPDTVLHARGANGAYLLDKKGVPLINLDNVATWLTAGGAGAFARDTFTGVLTWRGMPLEESDYGAITRSVQRAIVDGRHPFARCGTATVAEAILQAAAAQSFNSCVQWLDTLPAWDRTERMASFFVDVCGLDATDYLHAVGRYFWLSMVRRMVKPGSPADAAVCLVGPQGIGKSRLAQAVGGERYTSISLAHIGERDWSMQLRGKIIAEIAELSGHSRAELESIKAVLTRTMDEYRAPYARTAQSIPRGCIFVGSTNERNFLLDPSGNRRWLPVDCREAFNLGVLIATRDQLFAEAYHVARGDMAGGWWHVPGAFDVQADHVARDPWMDALEDALADSTGGRLERITNTEAYAALKIPAERQTGGGTGRRITGVMRAIGYLPSRWRKDGRTVRGFALPDDDGSPPSETVV